MSFSPIYGIKETRVTLFEDDGVTPKYRVTLQKENREGLDLAFKPEGQVHQLGSGAGWARQIIYRGYRPTLDIKWTHGLESTVETWDGTTWGSAVTVPTAQALHLVHDMGLRVPCSVSPHKDLNFDFLAQPDLGKAISLRDLKALLHTNLEISLIASVLIPGRPDWANLNLYFAAGYAADGFAGFQP